MVIAMQNKKPFPYPFYLVLSNINLISFKYAFDSAKKEPFTFIKKILIKEKLQKNTALKI